MSLSASAVVQEFAGTGEVLIDPCTDGAQAGTLSTRTQLSCKQSCRHRLSRQRLSRQTKQARVQALWGQVGVRATDPTSSPPSCKLQAAFESQFADICQSLSSLERHSAVVLQKRATVQDQVCCTHDQPTSSSRCLRVEEETAQICSIEDSFGSERDQQMQVCPPIEVHTPPFQFLGTLSPTPDGTTDMDLHPCSFTRTSWMSSCSAPRAGDEPFCSVATQPNGREDHRQLCSLTSHIGSCVVLVCSDRQRQ